MPNSSTAIKFCGLRSALDIEEANSIKPEYIGFVFWEESSRFIPKMVALKLKKLLSPDIKAVGVFLDEDVSTVASFLNEGIIDIAQLHGSEDEEYIKELRRLSGDKPIIKAFVINSKEDIERAKRSSADYILLDSGTGTGRTFNWELIRSENLIKPFFLAGGLNPDNVSEAVRALHPYAVDVSSGIETDKKKDSSKMQIFARNVRVR